MKAQRVNGTDANPAEDIRPLTLRNVRSAVRAAIDNEVITRQRVSALELWVIGWEKRTFWERVRWLVRGR